MIGIDRKAVEPNVSAVALEFGLPLRRLVARLAQALQFAGDEGLSGEIETLAHQDPHCERLMTVRGIGPIISSAMVAAIGTGTCSPKAATSAPG